MPEGINAAAAATLSSKVVAAVQECGRARELWATVDQVLLRQALVNLLSNSEKYSPDIKQIEIDIRQDDGRAIIAVSDRGIGIPAPFDGAVKVIRTLSRPAGIRAPSTALY